MKHPYSSFLLIFAFSLFIISCSKEHKNDCVSNELKGSWKWLRTDGGIGNNIHDTPASTGKNIDLVLTTDHKYIFFTNGIISSQGTFSLPIRNCIHDHSDKKVIDFSSQEDVDLMIESIDNDLLTLSDDNYDGTISQYSRN